MAGEGAMSYANVSLKNNRALAKRRKYRKAKNLIIKKSGMTKMEFKQVSSIELRKIKTQIRTKAKKEARRNVFLFVFSIALIVAIIYWAIN